MTSSDTAGDARVSVPRDLVTILFLPAVTMRRILARRDRMVIPLVLLVLVGGFIRDLDAKGFARAIQATPALHVALIVCGVLIAATLVCLALFWLFSWMVAAVGRLFEGSGTPRAVRSALAWGLTPFVWSLLYRIPLLFIYGSLGGSTAVRLSGEELTVRPGLMNGCGVALAYQLAELAVIAWVFVVSSHTLAVAHGYTPWRAFGTLLATMATPAIVVLAAFLAFK